MCVFLYLALYCLADHFFFLMIRRPPRSTLDRSSQRQMCIRDRNWSAPTKLGDMAINGDIAARDQNSVAAIWNEIEACLLYTSPSPRDRTRSRMPSSA